MIKLQILLFLAVCLSIQICSARFLRAPRWRGLNICRYKTVNSGTSNDQLHRPCRYWSRRLCQIIYGRWWHKPIIYFDCCPGWKRDIYGRCFIRTCIMLPQDARGKCRVERQTDLAGQDVFYKLTTPLEEPLAYPNETDNVLEAVPFPVLDQLSPNVIGRSILVPSLHEQDWVSRYIGLTGRINIFAAKYLQTIQPFTKYSDYSNLLETFRNEQQKDILSFKIPGVNRTVDLVNMTQYVRYPSQELPFKDIINENAWQDDDVFVQQRLAGLNPMALRKMTHDDFKQGHVNRQFNWDAAIQRASGLKSVFKKMINAGKVYIIDYKLLYDVTNVDDLTELNSTDRREMTTSRSPFCVFVVVKENGVNELKPVAIQTDLRTDAPVRSPVDRSKWLLAKMEIQRADITQSQLVEHLLKTHLLMEPICVIMRRTLSKYHPLFQILQWHCRGLFVTNTVGIEALLETDAGLHKLFTVGHTGSVEILNKAYPSTSWDDTEFDKNLQRRGVDDVDELPYFPYRDDGLIIWKEVGNFARDYVNLYYSSNRDVIRDHELANFANQLSADGTGNEGGIGMFKGFPCRISTKNQLIDVFKRTLFIPIQHNCVNYPIVYYGGFVPNLPTKLYEDPRVPPQEFGFHTLPQSHVATVKVALVMNLGSLRYDVIFDYGKHLKDDRARAVVDKYHARLVGSINDKITARNNKRLAEGKMSYPYLLPKWMPNSIHT